MNKKKDSRKPQYYARIWSPGGWMRITEDHDNIFTVNAEARKHKAYSRNVPMEICRVGARWDWTLTVGGDWRRAA